MAMKVAKPYKAVAEWCKGEVVYRHGPGSTVVGISIKGPYQELLFARVGDYIGTDPVHEGYFTTYREHEFEMYFSERKDNGSQDL